MNKPLYTAFRAVLFCVLFTALLAVCSPLIAMFPARLERYCYGLLGTVIALALTFLFLRRDRMDFAGIGIQWTSSSGKRFVIGVLIGLLASAALLTAPVLAGGLHLRWHATSGVFQFLLWGMALLPLSYMEEVAFRGYAFVTIKQTWGPWAAQVIIAILFALYHVAGGQSIISAFFGPGIFSLVFGAAALYSSGIAMPTGIHFAANMLLTAVGQKKAFPSLWTFEPVREISPELQSRIDTVGMAAQLVLLVCALFASYRIIRSDVTTSPHTSS